MAASTDAIAPAPSPANTVAAAVASARACEAPASTITNQPDGGVVFVNAWHRKDAGNIDRLEGIVDAIGAASREFRCCFDAWAARHPASEGRLLLQMEVAASGAIASTSILDSSTDIDHEVSRACVIQVAESLTYPTSPSSQATLVEYPFVVRAP